MLLSSCLHLRAPWSVYVFDLVRHISSLDLSQISAKCHFGAHWPSREAHASFLPCRNGHCSRLLRAGCQQMSTKRHTAARTQRLSMYPNPTLLQYTEAAPATKHPWTPLQGVALELPLSIPVHISAPMTGQPSDSTSSKKCVESHSK